MRSWLDLVMSAALLAALLCWGGCGGPDLAISGMLPLPTETPATTPSPTCGQPGEACGADTDCCSGACVSPDGETLECG